MHRKNSMFYKTPKGAEVGDVYMSLIHTCELCRVNPFAYLQALHKNVSQVLAQAAQWLPWNYHQQLAATLSRRSGPYAARRRQAGAARVRAGSPAISSTCSSQA
jgi:hypothetical protein